MLMIHFQDWLFLPLKLSFLQVLWNLNNKSEYLFINVILKLDLLDLIVLLSADDKVADWTITVLVITDSEAFSDMEFYLNLD